MLKILNAEPDNYSTKAREILGSVSEVVECNLSRDNLVNTISDYDVLITRLKHTVDEKIIENGRKLKAIVTATTGLDHIDSKYAEDKGIAVLSLKGETEFLQTIPATAEHTWALLLSLIRKIPQAYNYVCNEKWNRDLFRGTELKNKNLGIVGYGRIGKQIKNYALAFDMNVHVYDPKIHQLPDEVIGYQKLEDMLSAVDIVTLHLPLNKDTYGIIGHEEIDMCSTGTYLINTSRGDLVETGALLRALETGHLSGAALDVISKERDNMSSEKKALVEYANKHDNLLLTPHLGGATIESMEKTEIFMAKKLVNWVEEGMLIQ